MVTIADQIQTLLDEVRLPPHIHATVLAGRDEVTGAELAVPVVWADRAYTVCPRCSESVAREVRCPLSLNTGAGPGGEIREWDQEHGCGAWLPVLAVSVAVDTTTADVPGRVEAAARELAAAREAAVVAERARIRARLVRDLEWALDRLATPLDPAETPQDRIWAVSRGIAAGGDQAQPGIWLDTAQRAWVAWELDPDAEDGVEIILEAVATVSLGQAASMLGVSRGRVQALAAAGKLVRANGLTVDSVLDRMGL